MRIAIFGLGYVGTVTGACLARRGHSIVGVDVQPGKVEAFRRGEPTVVEPGLGELLAEAKRSDRLEATTSAADAVSGVDVSVVCVGTPSTLTGTLDLRFVRNVLGEISDALRQRPKPHCLVLRSTLLPGTTAELVGELLGGAVTREGPHPLEVVYYPEFLREGTAVADFEDPSLVIVGTSGEDVPPPAALAGTLIPEEAHVVPWSTAELVKYASNAFHATKVTFANEIGRFAKPLGVDARLVMELLCRDTKLNLSASYLRPGNPFGGSCLPKDVRALVRRSRQLDVELPMLESLLGSNQRHLESLLAIVNRTGLREVVILGLSFKPHTDDLRESSMVDVAETLFGRGYQVRLYDRTLNLRTLVGSNKRIIESKMPHLASLLRDDLGAALGDGGVVLAAQRVAPLEELASHVTARHHLVDINGWPELSSLGASYEGLCW
ncbi:MAG TPA: nucleotide sugar dehydrogenase [Thermoanaerobaculia bacterium]|nr:nucleotide sugar dehydrogenase [Thermoanaerobaculia bacterium]